MRVVVLGASGMLGSMVADVLSHDSNLELVCTVRDAKSMTEGQERLSGAQWKKLDAETASVEDIGRVLEGAKYAVNAIGVIKPYIHDDNTAEVERATKVNGLFPHRLAKAATTAGCRVLQIATDCVYSGMKGAYVEPDAHDALDVYGKSKSLGEVTAPSVSHLRCSIIGPEAKGHLSLLDWFRGQAQGAKVNGFLNHQWNGVTTYHYGRLCQGIISRQLETGHLQHIVPTATISKYDLLRSFAKAFKRDDIQIAATDAKTVIDRTLSTNDAAKNAAIWSAAGYSTPPTVEQMVDELGAFDYRFAPTA